MKRTIAAVALLASASTSQALIEPGVFGADETKSRQPERVICLSEYSPEADGSRNVGACDESNANRVYGLEIMANGCAEGQLALRSVSVQIESCPTAVQL